MADSISAIRVVQAVGITTTAMIAGKLSQDAELLPMCIYHFVDDG